MHGLSGTLGHTAHFLVETGLLQPHQPLGTSRTGTLEGGMTPQSARRRSRPSPVCTSSRRPSCRGRCSPRSSRYDTSPSACNSPGHLPGDPGRDISGHRQVDTRPSRREPSLSDHVVGELGIGHARSCGPHAQRERRADPSPAAATFSLRKEPRSASRPCCGAPTIPTACPMPLCGTQKNGPGRVRAGTHPIPGFHVGRITAATEEPAPAVMGPTVFPVWDRVQRSRGRGMPRLTQRRGQPRPDGSPDAAPRAGRPPPRRAGIREDGERPRPRGSARGA